MRMPLEYEGYEYLSAGTAEEGIALVQRESPDIVFLDVKMPGMDGMEALNRIKAISDSVPVVMISAHGTTATAFEASKRGASDFVEKPFGAERLLVTIKNQLDRTRLIAENRSLRRAAEVRHQMVGESPALKQVGDAIKRASPTNATVLLLGESGVGKELVARAIHRNSLRSRERFIQVNCAAIPEELIESELFGHVKGAITGAVADRRGKFETATGGTLFLDVVGDMSLKVQAKVLRALQEQVVEPVGGQTSVRVDVRVIAATNKDLADEIRQGRFREDLYFRLNVIPIFVPPLRDRGDDVLRLTEHFAVEFAREYGRRVKMLSPEAIAVLRQYRWPGNVRELRNIIERLMIMVPGDVVSAADLAFLDLGGAGVPAVTPASIEPLFDARDEWERRYILTALAAFEGNISRTADALGLERSNFYKKMRALGIAPVRDREETG